MLYIQKGNNNMPYHFDSACAMYGAIEQGMEYELVSYEDVNSGLYDDKLKIHLFVGSVEFMRCVFERLNISIEKYTLGINSNRESEIITLKEAFTYEEDIFIKPVEYKVFTGFVLDKMKYPHIEELPMDTKVYKYEVIDNIISEYRIYVHRNEIVDSKNYSGSFEYIPNYKYVNDIIDMYKDKLPNTYCIDIGILDTTENIVVEFNDMWAIGNYGIDNTDYLKLLKRRYFEIVY